jgi:hypothetical protein
VILGTEAATSLKNGTDNIVMGYQAGKKMTGSSQNVSIGRFAAVNLTTGSNNVFLGVGSGGGGAVTTTNSVFVGNGAVGNNSTNQTSIGYNAQATAANEMVLGGTALTHIRNSGDGKCDLGTTTKPFKNLYLKGDITLSTKKTPSTNTAPAATGTIRWDDEYLYIRTATAWKRVALNSF